MAENDQDFLNSKEQTPREIVAELDKYIVGQTSAKRSVAVALRNRWRSRQLPEKIRDDVIPKNILMIGSTGVGKTEIARRLAKLVKKSKRQNSLKLDMSDAMSNRLFAI